MARPRFGDEGDVETVVHSVRVESSRRVRGVVVIEGSDVGRRFVLDPDAPSRTLLGTSPVCAMRLSDVAVSRRHVAFEPAGVGCRITDLQSTNGTFVNGVAVVEAFVYGGETIRCGNTTLEVEVDDKGGAPDVPQASSFGRMIGASLAMRRLYPLCARIARSRVPVVLEGETGTGKEVLAEALHEVGGAGPFVVFDCTTVAPTLVESELFGHERGAFTGALNSRPGVFEEADGGTLLIDEIGDLDLPLQAKLLRVIDRGELRRVGGQKSIKVNVRILAATRRDLDRAIVEGTFRDDLFHRLAVARIELPPLRERLGDVPLLVQHFLSQLGAGPEAIPPAVLARFERYSWPGNLRELRNAVARYVAVGEEPVVSESAYAAPGESSDANADYRLPFAIARRHAIARFEREYIARLLEAHGGKVNQAARASGLAMRYFRVVKARMQKPEG
jgi:DNA-binding NtrC family response regulator